MITLYSTNCPKCKVLEQKMKQCEIPFSIQYDIQPLIKMGFLEAPILKINDNEYLNFSDAIKWLKNK